MVRSGSLFSLFQSLYIPQQQCCFAWLCHTRVVQGNSCSAVGTVVLVERDALKPIIPGVHQILLFARDQEHQLNAVEFLACIAQLQLLQFFMIALYFFALFVLRASAHQRHFDQIFLLCVRVGGEQIPFQGFQTVIAQLLVTGAAFTVVTMLQKSSKQLPVQPFFIRCRAGAERMQGMRFMCKPRPQNI